MGPQIYADNKMYVSNDPEVLLNLANVYYWVCSNGWARALAQQVCLDEYLWNNSHRHVGLGTVGPLD